MEKRVVETGPDVAPGLNCWHCWAAEAKHECQNCDMLLCPVCHKTHMCSDIWDIAGQWKNA